VDEDKQPEPAKQQFSSSNSIAAAPSIDSCSE
jgi:hypothetical protein